MMNANETLDLKHALLKNKDKEVRYILNKRTSSLQPSKTIIFNAIYFCSIDIVTLLYANDFFKESAFEAMVLASRLGRIDVLAFLEHKEPEVFTEVHFALLCQSVIAHSRSSYEYLNKKIELNVQEYYVVFLLALITENASVVEGFVAKKLDIAYAQNHIKEIFLVLRNSIEPEDAPFLTDSHLHKLARLLRKLDIHYQEHPDSSELPKTFFGKKSIHIYEYDETINEILHTLRHFETDKSQEKIKNELETLLLFFMARKILDGHPLHLSEGEAEFEASVIKNHLLLMQKSPKTQKKRAEKIIQQLQNS